MSTKHSSKTAKNFNVWRRWFQIFVVRVIIINLVRMKYNVHAPEGLENIKKGVKYVVASNHVASFDPFFIACQTKLTIAYMAKKELFEKFWSMLLMDWCGAFAVDREKLDVSTIKTALSVKKTSWDFGIFPQGTRCKGDKLENITKGFASIAKKMERDILPIGIVIKENIKNPKGKKDIFIRIGEPISAKMNIDEICTKWCEVVSKLADMSYVVPIVG